MRFLVQVIDNQGIREVKHDFCMEAAKSIEYMKWHDYMNEDEHSVRYCTYDELVSGLIDGYDRISPTDGDDIVSDYIPIGTIEFVFAYIDRYVRNGASKEIRPLNIPERLLKYSGRDTKNFVISSREDRLNISKMYKDQIFIKSNTEIKCPYNGYYDNKDILDNEIIPDGEYQISNIIPIMAEFRVFVFQDNVVGIHYYLGDFMSFPSICKIKEILHDYEWAKYDDVPVAFTLDVGVTAFGETVLMECHEFFSCGLYGFRDYRHLPYMFTKGFRAIEKRLLLNNNKN